MSVEARVTQLKNRENYLRQQLHGVSGVGRQLVLSLDDRRRVREEINTIRQVVKELKNEPVST